MSDIKVLPPELRTRVVLRPKPSSLEELRMQIDEHVNEYAVAAPVTLRALNRRFGVAASKLGGMAALLLELQEAGRIGVYMNDDGSRTFIFSADLWERVCEMQKTVPDAIANITKDLR